MSERGKTMYCVKCQTNADMFSDTGSEIKYTCPKCVKDGYPAGNQRIIEGKLELGKVNPKSCSVEGLTCPRNKDISGLFTWMDKRGLPYWHNVRDVMWILWALNGKKVRVTIEWE